MITESIHLLQKSLYYTKDDALTSQALSELKHIAFKYAELAFFYFNTAKLGLATRYYIVANQMLSKTYFSDINKKEILQIQYMILQVCIKVGDYFRAKNVIKDMENGMKELTFSSEETFPAEFKYIKAFTAFNILLLPQFAPMLSQEAIDVCKSDYFEVIADKRVSPAQSTVLKQLLEQVIFRVRLQSEPTYKHS